MAVLGCVADNFTGTNDAAPSLVRGGTSVYLYNGIPNQPALGKGPDRHHSPDRPDGAQVTVVALKSGTQKTSRVVADNLRAARFLLTQGAEQICFKYYSTFDSTPKGSIGSVANTLVDLMKAPYALLCPALPTNRQTMGRGMLPISDVPFRESHMKNHPLTPIWDYRISRLMEPQSRYECRYLTMEEVEHFSPGSLEQVLGSPLYLISNYKEPGDDSRIVAAFGHFPLLTGGNGLLEPLVQVQTNKLSSGGHVPESGTDGKALLLVGSCSKATLRQIAWYQDQGKLCYKLGLATMLDGKQTPEGAWRFIETHSSSPDTVLVYGPDAPEEVKELQKLGIRKVADMPGDATTRLAVRAVEQGYTRTISAGGEISGAVTKGLGFSSYWTGENVAPRVPVTVPAERPDICLILKSGNFRREDFSGRALTMTPKQQGHQHNDLERKTDSVLHDKLNSTVWTVHSLFQRGRTAGSSANMSFRHGDLVYIGTSGSCFSTINEEDFTITDLDETSVSGKEPSEEQPLHLALYKKSGDIGAVIHTRSAHFMLWTFVPDLSGRDYIPDRTSYLRIKLGIAGLIPYRRPGSDALLTAFRERVHRSQGYPLRNHGPVVPGRAITNTFYCPEELEESARVAWELYRAGLHHL